MSDSDSCNWWVCEEGKGPHGYFFIYIFILYFESADLRILKAIWNKNVCTRTGDTGGSICVANRKRESKEKRERHSKQKLLKGCHQVQNVTVFVILACLEFRNFLVDQPWWSTILDSVPWPLHFEIHFAGPVYVIWYVNWHYLSIVKVS